MRDMILACSTGMEANVVIKGRSAGVVSPAGSASGVVSILNAEIAPTGALNAYTAAIASGSVAWTGAYTSNHGTAIIGLSLGAKAAAGPSSSQEINLVGLDGSNAARVARMYIDSTGLNIISNPAGSQFNFGDTDPYWLLAKNVSGSAVSLKIFNNTSNAGTSAGIVIETGSANSYVLGYVQDANQFLLTLGAGLTSGMDRAVRWLHRSGDYRQQRTNHCHNPFLGWSGSGRWRTCHRVHSHDWDLLDKDDGLHDQWRDSRTACGPRCSVAIGPHGSRIDRGINENHLR